MPPELELGRSLWDGVSMRTWQELQGETGVGATCVGGTGRNRSPAKPWKPQQVGDVPFARRMCHLPPEQLLHFSTALVTPRLP